MTSDDTLIISYSRREAIEDGVLIDVSSTAKEAGFRYPVALTASAWVLCVGIPPQVTCQDEAGRLWDVLTMLRHAARGQGGEGSTIFFEVLVQNSKKSPQLFKLKAICGPNDDLSPCLTVMTPHED